jgi:archaellum component FlaF (FlaF/FlaG flagellin family)
MKPLDKKGATSVLIILLMVVLMVFGLTILTTTLSNKSLSDKKQAWLDEYYDLEGQVALELASVDSQLDQLKLDAKANGQSLETTYNDNLELIPYNDGYKLFLQVASDEDYSKYISVELELIMDPDINKTNYRIIAYSETQDLFEYEDIKFGNPFFPDKD